MHCYRDLRVHVFSSQGIAVDIDSPAFARLHTSTDDILCESNPYSITGSLPLVGDLKEAGYDIQVKYLNV